MFCVNVVMLQYSTVAFTSERSRLLTQLFTILSYTPAATARAFFSSLNQRKQKIILCGYCTKYLLCMRSYALGMLHTYKYSPVCMNRRYIHNKCGFVPVQKYRFLINAHSRKRYLEVLRANS